MTELASAAGTLLPLAADNLLAARNLMAFTLGFHIIIACVGVALPLVMLTAEYRGRKHNDPDALDLARKWSKAAAVLFAVGAVTGTVLSFELGLLWPGFMEQWGDVFGTGFAIEGIFFFTEAIFIAIYIYGWNRLEGWKHFWTGVPIVIAGIGGAFSVVAVNSWMNQPEGFALAADGSVVDVAPLDALFNPATAYEFPHMLLAAYMVCGFGLASDPVLGKVLTGLAELTCKTGSQQNQSGEGDVGKTSSKIHVRSLLQSAAQVRSVPRGSVEALPPILVY